MSRSLVKASVVMAVSCLAALSAAEQRPASMDPAASDREVIDEATQRILESAEKSAGGGWAFVFEPYLWSLGISGDIGLKGFGPINVDYTPKDVLHHLDWGVMARGEIRKGQWGILGDGLFAQLSSSGSPPGPIYENAHVKIQQGLASLALSYRLLEGRLGFLDVYAGARFNYLGINLGGSLDSDGLEDASHKAVERFSRALGEQVAAQLAANKSTAVEKVSSALADRVAVSSLREPLGQSFSAADMARILREVRRNSGAYRELLAATTEAQLAGAKGALPGKVKRRLEKAQRDFAKALAKKIEKELPTEFNGDQWWVDPLVGVRGQVNLTRWLFLAAQCDVGGFEAGSRIAWNLNGSIGINWTRSFFTEVGWRYYYIDYQDGGFVYKVAESGLFAGVGVKF